MTKVSFFLINDKQGGVCSHTLLCDYHELLEDLLHFFFQPNPQGCKIQLSLKNTGETLVLAVADNGVGLTPEKLQELEGKPHYMESTDERLDLRHGLGLLLVRQIVEVHHGTLLIESEPNKGYEARIVFGK